MGCTSAEGFSFVVFRHVLSLVVFYPEHRIVRQTRRFEAGSEGF